MKSFFKSLLASILGCFIALAIMCVIGLIIITAMAFSAEETYVVKNKTILSLNLEGQIADRGTPENPFAEILGFGDDSTLGLDDILYAIDRAEENEKIEGIYIKAGMFASSSAALKEIRDRLIKFKESGKFIVAYGDTYLQGGYYLSTVADKVIANPRGGVMWSGMSSSPMFYKGLLEKLGVEMQIFKVGTFKSAVEPFILDKMSEPNRQQVQSYINDLWKTMKEEVSASRNISADELNQLADSMLMLRKSELLVEKGLVDTLMFETDVNNYLKELVNSEKSDKLRLASIKNIASLPKANKKGSKDIIAILYTEGEITSGKGDNGITDGKTVKELQKLADNDKVKAVVLRINSPGGSAYASEQIWKAVTDLKEKKPIVVSMGGVAASGGYYMACNASKIIAQPNTITGSIGIFGMFPNGEGLAKKVGLTFDNVKTNKFSDFGEITRPMREEEKAILQAYIEDGYDLFLTRCSEGRGIPKDSLDLIAQGRVWTGNQALEIGLVDALGGIELAIKEAADLAGLESYSTSDYPRKKDFFQTLMDSKKEEMATKLMKEYLGSEYKTFQMIKSIKEQDCIQARMPYGLEIQ